MTRRHSLIGFGAGLIAGVVLAVAVMGDRAIPKAQAQLPPAAAAVPRYQIDAWSQSGLTSAAGTLVAGPQYGAYVCDARTGKVWLIVEGGKPKPLGKIE